MKKVRHIWRMIMGIIFLLLGTAGLTGCNQPPQVRGDVATPVPPEHTTEKPATQPKNQPDQKHPIQPVMTGPIIPRMDS